jgi:hypothetical protein
MLEQGVDLDDDLVGGESYRARIRKDRAAVGARLAACAAVRRAR